MWIIAVCVAAIAMVPMILFEDRMPWLVALPMLVAAIIGLAIEIREDLKERQRSKAFRTARQKQEREAASKFDLSSFYPDEKSRREQFRDNKIVNDPNSMRVAAHAG